MGMEIDYEKFRDLVHYICHIADRDELGAVKLNKILWYCDIVSYISRGEPITGAVYVKRQLGPVPRDVLSAIEDLVRQGKLIVRDVPCFENSKKEYISLCEPEITRFDASEINLAATIAHHICHHHTAASISNATHDIVWELAEIGEEIPYYAVYGGRFGEITEETIRWAEESIANNEAILSEAS
jgi:hypothetical protein